MDTSNFNFISLKKGTFGSAAYDGMSLGKGASFVITKTLLGRLGNPVHVGIELDVDSKVIKLTANPSDGLQARKVSIGEYNSQGSLSGATAAKAMNMPEGRYHYVTNVGPDAVICAHQSVELHS